MCLIQQSGTYVSFSSNVISPLASPPIPLHLWNGPAKGPHPANDFSLLDPFAQAATYAIKSSTMLLRTANGAMLSPLPVHEEATRNYYELPAPEEQLVLVIDDEDDVRTVTVEVLQEAQLKTLQAANGPAGIALFRQHASQIKLVILDFFMPGMNGEQVLNKLRSIDPRIPVIFFSGFSEQEVMGRIQLRSDVAFLQKPYTINALWQIVQQYL